MATSSKQIAANRANAQRSTGPRTAQGKIASSKNSRIHGILSRDLTVGNEDPAEYAALLDELVNDFKPEGASEHLLAEKIAIALWKMKRLNAVESATVKQAQRTITARSTASSPEYEDPGLRTALTANAIPVNSLRFIRYQAQLEGQYYRALTMLQLVQTRRLERMAVDVSTPQISPM